MHVNFKPFFPSTNQPTIFQSPIVFYVQPYQVHMYKHFEKRFTLEERRERPKNGKG